MPEYVRVKDPDAGFEFTTGAQHARNAGLSVTDKPALDRFGRPLPAKPIRSRKPGKSAGETDSGDAGKEHESWLSRSPRVSSGTGW